jgi:hypothetical protein
MKEFIGGGTGSAPRPALPSGLLSQTPKKVERLWWTYGAIETPVTAVSRHFCDLNLHVSTQGYLAGEMVEINVSFIGADDRTVQLTIPIEITEKGSGVSRNCLNQHRVQIQPV